MCHFFRTNPPSVSRTEAGLSNKRYRHRQDPLNHNCFCTKKKRRPSGPKMPGWEKFKQAQLPVLRSSGRTFAAGAHMGVWAAGGRVMGSRVSSYHQAGAPVAGSTRFLGENHIRTAGKRTRGWDRPSGMESLLLASHSSKGLCAGPAQLGWDSHQREQ